MEEALMKFNLSKIGTLVVMTSLVTTLLAPQAHAEGTTTTPAPSATIKSDIQLAKDKGAIQGYPGTTDLMASKSVTRGELAVMINRAAKLAKVQVKKKSYSDTADWNNEAVENATAASIIKGVGYSLFQPNRTVTREELAAIVVRSMTNGQVPQVDEEVLNYFKDNAKISAWARPFVAYAALEGLYDLKLDSNFDPQAPVTRAEAAKALKPVLFNVVDILSTNDIHGQIEVRYDKTRKQGQGGMETLGGIVNEFRKINPNRTVVVDGGDAWQGTLISNTTNGQSVMDSMAEVNYDAAAIGNHEFDFGRQTLIDNIKKAKFPILGANIIDDATGKRVDWTQPYTIVEKDGLKIGIIGLATPETTTTTKSTNIEGLSFKDPVPFAKDLSAELRAKGADIVMVTSHLPGEQDAKTDQIMSALADLANGTGNGTLDAIVGGHSHKRVSGIVNGIPVVEAQNWLSAVGHIQLFVDKDTKKIASSNAALLETYTNLTEADTDVQKIVNDYKSKIAEKANEVEATADTKLTRLSYRYDINGKVDRDGITPLGASITDAMRASEKSDIAFTNIGGVRADIEPGNVTYSNMFEVLPFGNYNVTSTMTAEQIKKAFEVLDKYTKLPSLQFSGVKVEWDNTRPEGDKFTKIELLDGTPVYADGKFNTDRTFKATTNDFMATGKGDGFTVFGEVKDWKDGAILLDAWVKYANDLKAAGKPLAAPNDGRDFRADLEKK
jgi:2',3'-cyclic-nucleotide 2'-phosphodiesterase / 3'-nucleotidase / 5'-nucleotidase